MSITGSEETYYCDCKTFCGGIWTQIKCLRAFKHERVRKDLEHAGEDGVDWPSGSNNHRTGGMDELRLDGAVGRDLGLSSKRSQEEEDEEKDVEEEDEEKDVEEEDEEKDVEEADEVHSSVDEHSSESDGKEGPSGYDRNPRNSERENDIRNSKRGCGSEDGLEVADRGYLLHDQTL
ncbi:hypothetical protein BT69DRAFT_1300761 [Atractiella rhizophila]|nr:hypothetical protein BT69DRAFT_1300761 [Atractiella rhizophila]